MNEKRLRLQMYDNIMKPEGTPVVLMKYILGLERESKKVKIKPISFSASQNEDNITFTCSNCQTSFELSQGKVDLKAVVACPSCCRKGKVRKE